MECCKSKNMSDRKIKVQKLEMKNSRPTPDIAITQDCSSSGMKFLFLILFIFRFSSFVKIYFYSFIL